MKRKISYLLIIIISMFMYSEVGAKELQNECNYELSGGVSVNCKIYDNNSHSCTFSNADKENKKIEFKNWGNDAVFNAKDYYSKNKKCPANVIFVDTHRAIGRYELYAAESKETITEYQKRTDPAFDDVAISGEEYKDSIAPGFEDTITNYLNSICLFNENTGKYYYDKNKSGGRPCYDGILAGINELKAKDEYVEELIANGTLSENDPSVIDYYKRRDELAAKLDFDLVGKDFADPGYNPTGSGNDNDEDDEQFVTDDETLKILMRIYDIIKILIPVLIIVLSTVDFLKVVIYDDEKNYKSAFDKLVKRLVIGVVFFLLPILISFVLKYSGLDIEQSYLEIFK